VFDNGVCVCVYYEFALQRRSGIFCIKKGLCNVGGLGLI
jgi:hypothetical protein